jgi:hypothetical protein
VVADLEARMDSMRGMGKLDALRGRYEEARQRAEQAGNSLRQLYPGEDVYVHFYSPRWICRLGNYRTYEEAHEKMLEIRKMGYESATVVKGKITVTQ